MEKLRNKATKYQRTLKISRNTKYKGRACFPEHGELVALNVQHGEVDRRRALSLDQRVEREALHLSKIN